MEVAHSFHTECMSFASTSVPCNAQAAKHAKPAEVFKEDLAVDDWSVDLIFQWLTASNLFLYLDHFRANIGSLLMKVSSMIRRTL
jgi:hypothetical protein